MCSLSIAEDFQKSFLHGELTIQILKAEDLSGADENAHNQGNASCIFLKRAFKFSQKLENPFVGVYLGNNCICQTSCHSNEYEFEINIPKTSMCYSYLITFIIEIYSVYNSLLFQFKSCLERTFFCSCL